MREVLIFGSGSIGNHLAYACRKLNLSVSVTDISSSALLRMKNKIYPFRYSKWDNKIQLIKYFNVFKLKKKFDLIIIGTPPETHYSLINKIFKKLNFEKLMVEKPLSTFKDKINYNKIRLQTNEKKIFIGYNHSISKSFLYFKNRIKNIKKKDISIIDVSWREGWKGILNAHFWNKNEFSTYLGNLSKGGGSTHEHSHGLHLIVCLSKVLNFKLPKKFVKFHFIKKKNKIDYYDNYLNINWKLDNFLINYTSDLISDPANKSISIITKSKKYDLIFNYMGKYDLVKISNLRSGLSKIKYFNKNRSSDFVNEISYILKIKTKQKYKKSFLNVIKGIETQQIINSIFKSV